MAPGTVGTLVGFPLYWIIQILPFEMQAVILSLCFVVGIWICDVAGKAVGEADHSGIVWDEIACFAGVLAFVPFALSWWIGAFVSFRFFDIIKIWPASWIDNNIKNGFGVMLDDLVAAAYAVLALTIVHYALN